MLIIRTQFTVCNRGVDRSESVLNHTQVLIDKVPTLSAYQRQTGTIPFPWQPILGADQGDWSIYSANLFLM